MQTSADNSDEGLVALLRGAGSMSIAELVSATSVTATAVRQRLNRLMGQGLVRRETTKALRGRPSHRYSLTEKARRRSGNNFADLTVVLWEQVRAIEDPAFRRGLLSRIAASLAEMYRDRVNGATLTQRLQSLSELFAERCVPLQANTGGQFPILTIEDCPYPDLAARDRGVCAMEKMLFSELLAQDVRLSQCRLDGHACCQFETN